MPEPTIDEMLAWLPCAVNPHFDNDDYCRKAIRAILEQVKLMEVMGVRKQVQLEGIRAFVERVEQRTQEMSAGSDLWVAALYDELAAMESDR